VDFDFTFAGLGRFAEAAVDALGLDRFHLVVHDAGGPVGFELAASAPGRVRSLTILNAGPWRRARGGRDRTAAAVAGPAAQCAGGRAGLVGPAGESRPWAWSRPAGNGAQPPRRGSPVPPVTAIPGLRALATVPLTAREPVSAPRGSGRGPRRHLDGSGRAGRVGE
jgi:pimeloyl-ACP methyl ester carboxylesterase